MNFDDIFSIVKKSVEKTLKQHRAGLTLILSELPNAIGAYHAMGSNYIVMNKTIMDSVFTLAKNKKEYNSFIFSIFTHEYLHALGYVNEEKVRKLVFRVSEDNFGRNHPVTNISSKGIIEIYPELRNLGEGRIGNKQIIIKKFDTSSMPYIS